MSRWLGIDFSGNWRMWTPGCRRSNVWVAEVLQEGADLQLRQLRPVQRLPGSEEHPFERLGEYLSGEDYVAAGIDAPFSIPFNFHHDRGHSSLLKLVENMGLVGNRRFPEAESFVTEACGLAPPLDPPKPLRQTELYWREHGVNVRSTLWAGARGGAAMTAACLCLLGRARCPIWPWKMDTDRLLVEAFPAAQLSTWGCPHQQYNGSGRIDEVNRRTIVRELLKRLRIPSAQRSVVLGNADALDAVLCAFAAMAVMTGQSLVPPTAAAKTEGWIAVHAP